MAAEVLTKDNPPGRGRSKPLCDRLGFLRAIAAFQARRSPRVGEVAASVNASSHKGVGVSIAQLLFLDLAHGVAGELSRDEDALGLLEFGQFV